MLQVWHGSRTKLPVNSLRIDPNPKYTDERKISLGLYFTSNKKLSELYGIPISADLDFQSLLDLTHLDRFTPAEFFECIPLDIPEKLKAEIVGGYTAQMDGHHILESLLSRFDFVNRLKQQGYDGVAFREAYSDVYVPFYRSVINERDNSNAIRLPVRASSERATYTGR